MVMVIVSRFRIHSTHMNLLLGATNNGGIDEWEDTRGGNFLLRSSISLIIGFIDLSDDDMNVARAVCTVRLDKRLKEREKEMYFDAGRAAGPENKNTKSIYYHI